MTHDRQRAESIVAAALAFSSPRDRDAYVDRACGRDAALRNAVEDLLRKQIEESSLSTVHPPGEAEQSLTDEGLPPPPEQDWERFSPPPFDYEKRAQAMRGEGPGSLIGPYKLLQKLGEGGMGVVYLAEQQQPVRRRVALKVIKPGMDGGQFVARFEAERQALAMMEHPNIAKVLDAGTTQGEPGGVSSGRPYFVMELVKGVPITRYCDDLHLPLRERLKLFVPVCQAIQHAHQKGIIHRDIKPSNVLVSVQDGEPVPKVIDFGVAKALHQRLTDASVHTALGHIVGTLEYMAPEQIELNALDIDTRADIYALGVLLYELLTGSPPLDRKRLRHAAFPEMLRLVKESEPQRPSARLSLLGRERPTSTTAAGGGGEPTTSTLHRLAVQRRTDPARLVKAVRGDLDWIVMKCLDKDRTRRYESADSLARDVQRYLNDEPVEACPPSAGYRLRKLAHKHRALIATAITLAALLVAGASISTWQAIRASSAELDARLQRDAATAAASDARVERDRAVQERSRADQQAAIAQAVNEFFLSDILAHANPERHPDRNLKLRTVLDMAASRVHERFRNEPALEASIRLTLGDAYRALGEYRAAREHLEAAFTLRRDHRGEDSPESIQAMLALARLCRVQGDLHRSESLYSRAFDLSSKAQGPDHPDTLTALHGQGTILNSMQRNAEAEAFFKKVVDARRRVLGPDHPQTLKSLQYLAVSYFNQGKLEQADAIFPDLLASTARTLGEEHPDTLALTTFYAGALTQRKRFDAAEPLQKRAVASLRKTLGDARELTLWGMIDLAWIYHAQGKQLEEQQVLEGLVDSINHHPDRGTPMFAELLADLGLRLWYRKAHPQAELLLRECLELRERHIPDHWLTFNARSMLGAAVAGQGRFAEAESLMITGYEGMRAREGMIPAEARDRLSEAVERFVQLYEAWNKPEKAEEWRRKLPSKGPGQSRGPKES